MGHKSKVIWVALLMFCLHLTLLAQDITLNLSNITVKEAIEILKKEYGYSFVFESGDIDTKKIISIKLENKKVDEIVKQILHGQDVSYEINNKNIAIYKKQQTVQPLVQSKRIMQGIIIDQAGEPVVGASVTEKGTTNGTLTDTDGNFSLSVLPTTILQISYIGYNMLEIPVGNQRDLIITMEEEVKGLDEVVVIGYGTSRRRDLVGAVNQIDNKLINERASMNISSSLQGQLPGLTVSIRDGKPARGATIDLRGATSIGSGGSPLILIDGVEAHGDLTTVNPMDVENISVLKDASSAAIYGAKGAFGVILITTKSASGKEKPKISYNGSVSCHHRLVKPDIVNNGLQWTEAYLNAYAAGRGGVPSSFDDVLSFSDGSLQNWLDELRRRDANPTLEKVVLDDVTGKWRYYGNTDWIDLFYKDNTYSTEHNISISGGNENTKYYISGRYFNQDGIYKVGDDKYTQYNFMAKGQLKLNKRITLDNKTDFITRRINQPIVMYGRQLAMRQISRKGFPVTVPQNPDKTWTISGVYTGYAGFVEGTSFQLNNKFDVKNTTTLTYIPVKELIFKGDFSYYYNHSERDRVEGLYEYFDGPTISSWKNTFSSLEHWDYNNTYQSSNLTANYVSNLSEDHKVNILAGINSEHKYQKNVKAYRRGLVYQEKPTFALMDGDYYATAQSGYEWSYLGLLYRINYNYKYRYLAELSGRYDGSSKFPDGQKWGFFPSLSLGWRVSEESFMAWSNKRLDNLKIRISVGSLGNGNIAPFKYLSSLSLAKTGIIIDDNVKSYTSAPYNIPLSLTWETTINHNIGIDIDMFDNRLNFVFDYYNRYITDMFTPGMEVPAVFGANVPYGNNADMKTKGWEVSLQWRNSFNLAGKPFNYSIKAMMWDNRSWITKYNNIQKLLGMGQNPNYYEGMEIGEMWGYHVEGLFLDQKDIDTHADQSTIRVSDADVYRPGDIKFADLNNDNVINTGANTVADPGDRRIIGNNRPRYSFGVNWNANWNGFGINVLIQGVGKKNWYPHRESPLFWGQYDRPYEHLLKMHTGDNVYTDENQNFGAYWPRYRAYLANNANRSMGLVNDRYLQNVAYVRLKNLQLDYTFNKRFCNTLHVSDLRLYVSGENIFTWSPLFKVTRNFDPEAIYAGDPDFNARDNNDQDGSGYPMMSAYTFGISLTF